jgi:hypothetical protein
MAQKITPKSAFALSVLAKHFAKCSAKSFDNCFVKFCFLIHFLPAFQSILKIQASYRYQFFDLNNVFIFGKKMKFCQVLLMKFKKTTKNVRKN